jgi:hypothetical protein
MKIISAIYSAIISVISKLFFLLEFFLFLRLLLKFLNANPRAFVANLIYKYSDIIITPFDSIFSDVYWHGHTIDLVTISTMVGYAIAIFIIFQLVKVFSGE